MENERKNNQIKYQLKKVAGLVFLTLCYFIFSEIWPDFFDLSSLWIRTDNIWTSVSKFWWFFAFWPMLAFFNQVQPTTSNTTLFGKTLITSTLAGIWEEIGYRGLYIWTLMISLTISNTFFWYIAFFVLIVFLLASIAKLADVPILGIIGSIVSIGLLILLCTTDLKDPIFWMNEHILIPLHKYLSFGFLNPIVDTTEFSTLFVAAALLANIKFRDGHKYQGPSGLITAWIAGFILLYIMMYHGLVVAIIVHALYDIIHTIAEFTRSKLSS